MPTVRFTLTWPDGATASATVTATHANDRAPVAYTGAADRLAGALTNCASTTLLAYLLHLAETTGASLDEWQSAPWPDEDDLIR